MFAPFVVRALLVVSLIFGAGCASSSNGSNGSSGDGASSGTSGAAGSLTACSDVCAAVERTCRARPPSCEQQCASLAETVKRCVVGASTCSDVDACGQAREDDDDKAPSSSSSSSSSSSGSSDPCAACTASQGCVSASSVSSEVGCFDPPTCSGASPCDCLYAKGTSPCANGTKSCTWGGANRVVCR